MPGALARLAETVMNPLDASTGGVSYKAPVFLWLTVQSMVLEPYHGG